MPLLTDPSLDHSGDVAASAAATAAAATLVNTNRRGRAQAAAVYCGRYTFAWSTKREYSSPPFQQQGAGTHLNSFGQLVFCRERVRPVTTIHFARNQDLARNAPVDANDAEKSYAADSAAEQIVVRQASSESGTASPEPPDMLADAECIEDSIWYDCQEDFEASPDQGVSLFNSNNSTENALHQACAGLPAELASLVMKYIQGRWIGCKPTVALIQYMESSGTTLQQLKQQLAPVLAAEQASAAQPSNADNSTAATAGNDLQLNSSQLMQNHSATTQQPAAVMYIANSSSSSSSSDSKNPGPKQPPLKQQTLAQQADQNPYAQNPSVARLLANVEVVQESLAGFNQQEGYKQVAWGHLEMWYMHDTVNQRQLVRARTVLNEPVVHAVCLAREFDVVPGWNPAILDCKELKAYSPSELLVYILSWCPWPLPCPETLNYAVGVDLLDTQAGCVLLATNAPTEAQMEGVPVPQHPRTIRMTMHAGGFKFTPLQPDPSTPHLPRMEAVMLMSMDTKRFVVPDSIISFLLKVFAPLVYKSVIKVLEKMFHTRAQKAVGGNVGDQSEHSVLLDRLESRPEYAAMHRHCCKYVENLSQQRQGSQ